MTFELFLLICGASVPHGQCAPPVAAIERRYPAKDRLACQAAMGEFIAWWSLRDTARDPGLHFVVTCRELPDA